MRRVASVTGAAAVMLLAAGTVASAAPGDAFTISGNLDHTLYPGGSGAVDLLLTNPGATQLTVGELSVAVAGVTPLPQRTCLVSDFVITQLDPAAQFSLPASSTLSLTQLGVSPADLPTVTMTNTPVNQDGCKGATVNLAFAGKAAEVAGVVIPPPASPSPAPTPAPNPKPTPSADHGIVGGAFLPGTGANGMSFWVALGGFGLVVLGTGSVLVTRRTKGSAR